MPSNEELKQELLIKKELEKHREESDRRYAVKLVERVLWALLASAFLWLVFYFFSNIHK